METKDKLAKLQKQFNRQLEKYLEGKVREFKSLPLMERMMREIESFVMGDGKRVRPIFVLYGYLAAGGKEKAKIMEAAIFAELIHDYFLVHDDLIDQDDRRHNLPSFHRRYEIFYSRSHNARHLGATAAILAGDMLSVLGYDALVKSKFAPGLKNKAAEELNQMIFDVISGQTFDVFLGLDHYLTEDEISKIQRFKTSRYTVDGPMRIGAILAGADGKTLKRISEYAIPLGIAFQIQDDILGMFGNTKKTGKPSGADLREGKQTLLILKARKLANRKQKQAIEKALGNPNLTQKQLGSVRKIIVETGSLDYSKKLAEKLVSQAKRTVERSNFPAEIKNFLIGMGDFIIKREK